jgi:hypothetical protein
MNKSIFWDSPIFVFKRPHKCPNCTHGIIPKKVKNIVNSKSPEAKEFDFSMGDSYFAGDVEFTYYVFYCEYCNKDYKISEIKNYEKEKKANEIMNKGGNKVLVKIRLFLNKLLLFLFCTLVLFSCSKGHNKTEYINKSFIAYDIYDNLKSYIELADVQKEYLTNKNTLQIKCSIKNDSDISESIYLMESYLSHSTSFYINLYDKNGNILAQEFSGYFYSSELISRDEYLEKLADSVIILNPDEEIIKIFYFKDIIGHFFINDMDNGKYFINIVFINRDKNDENKKKYISNIIEINITK